MKAKHKKKKIVAQHCYYLEINLIYWSDKMDKFHHMTAPFSQSHCVCVSFPASLIQKNRSYQAHSLISFIFLCVYFQCILAQYMCEFLTWSYLDAFRWWLINSRFKRFFSCKAAWSFAFWEGRESNKERVGCLVPLSSCLQGNLYLSASHTAKLHLKIII